jgi:hypothetical protein
MFASSAQNQHKGTQEYNEYDENDASMSVRSLAIELVSGLV